MNLAHRVDRLAAKTPAAARIIHVHYEYDGPEARPCAECQKLSPEARAAALSDPRALIIRVTREEAEHDAGTPSKQAGE